MSFSMYSNGKNLFKTTKTSEHMKPLDGMRVLSTCWIVLLHTKILLGNHSINPLKALTVREINYFPSNFPVFNRIIFSGRERCKSSRTYIWSHCCRYIFFPKRFFSVHGILPKYQYQRLLRCSFAIYP